MLQLLQRQTDLTTLSMGADNTEGVGRGVLIDLNVGLSSVVPLPGGIVVQHHRRNRRRQCLLANTVSHQITVTNVSLDRFSDESGDVSSNIAATSPSYRLSLATIHIYNRLAGIPYPRVNPTRPV